ncbi:hypothetical protein [Pontitalea aquivivens]|uniref:hypothetical protein n=1 Tax=Pontitalea aquivivens TaxID=3388663 RepID=UPI003970B676
MMGRLGVDKVAGGLTGQETDQIAEAGIRLGARETRGVGVRRFDGEMQCLRFGLSLSCQEVAIRFSRVEVRKTKNDISK